MNKNFYVTTPIYYVNAEPHIGHGYTTLLADFMKRFYQNIGYDSYFLTGTDEHGDKIAEAAEKGNMTPQEYTDIISHKFRSTWDKMEISYDDFIRTTDERHIQVVQEILQKVYDQGDIYFGTYGGNYCVGCERFLTDKELVDGNLCPDHMKPVKYIEESNYFFKMSNYQEWLINYIEENPDFIRPERYKKEVLSILKNGELEDLCISRPKSRLTWGVTLPFDEKYVTYVWFDALINYISALGYPDNEKFNKYWPTVNHITAKDIVKPHGIFWPTMLKAIGIEPYQHLNVHGYWNMKDAKMSKSLGNVVRPDDLIEKYGNDQIRYFFLREMNFGSDASFSEEAIFNRINFDLANDLGNLINRTLNMVKKYFDYKIPEFSKNAPANKEEVLTEFSNAKNSYIEHCKKFQISQGIEEIWKFIRFLNKYVDSQKPWQLAKENKTEELASTLRNLLEGICAVAFLIEPVCIKSVPKIFKTLQIKKEDINFTDLEKLNNLKTGVELQKLDILFPKIEQKKEEKKPEQKEKKKNDVEGLLVDIKDFTKLDLRVSQILEAEPVEGSEKLLKLKIDTGIDQRTIAAGIAKDYQAQSLIGKKIIVVVNLKPAKIFTVESHGMLLAAKKDKKDHPHLIEINPEIEVGSKLG